MRQLLEDPIYRAWIRKIPTARFFYPSGKPWRLWVQRETGGGWAMQDFKSYAKAFNHMNRLLKQGVHDAALGCKGEEFKPPVVKDKKVNKRRYHIPAFPGQNAGHRWCGYCRRPTIFAYFKRHHALPGRDITNYDRRCAVCGHREKTMKAWH